MGSSPALADQDDTVLVTLVAGGDTAALEELYDRHAGWLVARLMRRCNDSDVVLDVVQDTFVTVWKDARRYRGTGEVAGWLWGIAFRRMVSRLRSRKDVVLLPEWDTVGRGHVPAAEDEVLLGVEYGDLAGALRPALARVPLGRPGVRARRPDHQGGRQAARRPREHREDPAPPGQGPAARIPRPATGGMAMTTTWHVHDDLLAAYVAGRLDAIVGASVEQHLARCAECRASTTPLVDPLLLSRGWDAVRDTVESPALPLPVRLARRCGLSEPTSVLLAATTSLRTAWVVGAFVALTFAARGRHARGRQAARAVPARRAARARDRRRRGLRLSSRTRSRRSSSPRPTAGPG